MSESAVPAAVQPPAGPRHRELSPPAALDQRADGLRGDRELNEHGCIVPGLGDAGDWIQGTRWRIGNSLRQKNLWASFGSGSLPST